MKIGLKYKGKKKEVEVKECKGIRKGTGLTFTRRQKARALLFRFKHPDKIALTALFVFFPFIAIWLDDKNKIVDMRIVKPFTFHIVPDKPFIKVVEIPINAKYRELVRFLVGNQKGLNRELD